MTTATITPPAEAELTALLPRFGLETFRPGQLEVIRAVLADEDCLCVMPTGGGKSLCYQLPALARRGVTLVVSPLIALMKDQVDQLLAHDMRATLINSTLSMAEQNARLDGLVRGDYDLVYVVPERFRSPRFLEAVRGTQLRLLAIDEAHCVSHWGHDFRPDYAKLGRFRRMLGMPPTIALTATATDAVRRDIIELLGLREPRTFITGFARPNLNYAVRYAASSKQKDEALIDFLRTTPGDGIVYASSRKKCEEVAALINADTGRSAVVYHAGMEKDDRRQAQDAFMTGRREIVVATTAFGMGIDKPNVRFVLHYNLPGSLEGYYQEAGRAGRDGLPAQCTLLYSPSDRRIQEFFIESRYPAREVVARVYDYLRQIDGDPIELTQHEIKERLALPIGAEGVGACEQLLEKAGVLERLEPCQNMALVRLDSDAPRMIDLLTPQATVQRRVLQALDQMVGPRRWEQVYFQPRDLLDMTELEPVALTRALGELKSLKCFDYVPPFRGRAVHMLERKKPFNTLDLDFEQLEQRKTAEYEKLRRILALATSRDCREQEILSYFGQADSPPCGRCDNCRAHGRGAKARSTTDGANTTTLSPGVQAAVRVALAGVARTHGRFGKTIVVQMLCGSRSTKLTQFGLAKLSTYGLLERFKQDDVGELLVALIDAGCIEQTNLETARPRVQLTALGREVMTGQQTLATLSLSPTLAGALRSFRAPGETVKPVAKAAPQEEPSAPIEPTPVEPPPPSKESSPTKQPPAQVAAPAAGTQPSYHWTWRLLADGYTLAECQEIRRLDRAIIIDHLHRATEQGWPVDPGWLE